MLWGRPFLEIFTPPSPWSPILLNRLMKECHLLSDPPSLNILFRQITTFIKVCVAFVFGLPTLQLIRFTKFFQSKGLKPKNKGHRNFYECCDLTKKVYLTLPPKWVTLFMDDLYDIPCRIRQNRCAQQNTPIIVMEIFYSIKKILG